jgi:hypothetical protein
MTSDGRPPQKPALRRSAETEAREEERRKRLAAALRENLRRRKTPAPGSGPAGSGEQD